MVIKTVQADDMYLIQGIFFKRNEWYLFSGLIEHNPGHPLGWLKGKLTDTFGDSVLSDVSIGNLMLRFDKTYTHRDYAIKYMFTMDDDGSWIGTYDSVRTGRGSCRCILKRVTPEFFEPLML